MQVMVTGGAGYIGSVLARVLVDKGHRVRAIDNLSQGGRALTALWSHPLFEFRRGDIRDRGFLEGAAEGSDAVVHLAAIVGDPACSREPDLARAVTRDASLLFLEIAGRSARRFIFASTCSNYGRMADPTQLVSETSELRPISLYAETKVDVERAILEASGSSPSCSSVVRFATVYGVSPRMRFDLTVNEFAAELCLKRELVVYGEQFWRPYIHVRDAARGILAVLESPEEQVAGEVFNVGDTSENYRKLDLVELLKARIPDARVSFVHKDEDPRDYRVCFDKFARTVGFEITRSVPEGIDEVMGLFEHGVIADYDDASYRN